MNNLKITLAFIFFLSLISCSNDESETLTFSVRDGDNILSTVVVENLGDGTGTLTGELIFSNDDSVFDATFNNADEVTTNFVVTAAEGEYLSGEANGNGFYTPDSISFVIQKTVSGVAIETQYTGNR